ncbi:hypothetical protein BN946_scf184946.g17 [Trametes cinnabarina]|uniref:Uncharacterized protein n=1 Tax=Pycnoporus cinnabarinus TaxID=5643 RepID=A0A060SZC3_PYCCI|nr:hypothetical protein BN946_scf184946.g17 [Trametes cinnabarina]
MPDTAYYKHQPHPPYSPKHYHNDRASFSGRASTSHSSATQHAYPSMRRSHTLGSPYGPADEDASAWQHMAKTCAWVLEQQFAQMAEQNEEDVRWIREQQERDRMREQVVFRIIASGRRGWPAVEEVLYSDRYAGLERSERRRRRWEEEVELSFEEEMRRLNAYRRECERYRAAYEKRKRAEEETERAHRERERAALKARREEAERDAQEVYEARWTELLSTLESLGFRDIPWPMFSQPRTLDEITSARVTRFVLSPLHPGETRRDKVRNALRRWHPDRFGRVLARVDEGEKETVEEGVGIVVRCLNDLLARENQ